MSNQLLKTAAGVPNAAAATVAPVGAYAWYISFVLCVGNFFAFLDRHLMALVSEPVRHSLNVSDVQLGLLQGTGFAILYCFAAIPLGWVADFANRRNLIIFGMTVWSLATAGAAFSHSFGALFFSRLFVGIGEAALLPAAMSMLAAYFHKAKLGRGIAVFSCGALLGHGGAFMIGGAMLGWMTLRGGLTVPGLGVFEPWQGLFLMAGMAGVVIVLLMFTVREPVRTTRPSADWAGRGRSFLEALGYMRSNGRAYGVQMCLQTAATSIGYMIAAWGVSVFVRGHGLTVPQAAAIMGGVTLTVGPLGNLLGGFLTDRAVARGVTGAPLVVIGGALVLTLIAASIFCLGTTLPMSIGGFILLQFAVMIPMSALYGSTQMLTPDRFRGIAASVTMLVYSLFALGVGPPLVGFVTDRLMGGPEKLPLGLLATILAFGAWGLCFAFFGRQTFERGREKAARYVG